jgi:exopolysaccharide biosynthesis protein
VKRFWALITASAIALSVFSNADNAAYRIETRTVTINKKRISVTVVRADRNRMRVGVAIAENRIGTRASLGRIAKQARATCAINGTFLAAYKGQSGEPYGTLAIGGRWLHLGSSGTRLDVFENEQMRFVRDDLRVLGGLSGRWTYPNNWYAYGLNQTPQNRSSSYVFTPERGNNLGFRAEVAIIVKADTVVSIEENSNSSIPKDGFVVALSGKEAQQLAGRFRMGSPIAYRVNSKSGLALEGVRDSLGAGPRLLEEGQIALAPLEEGFTSSRVLSEHNARSAIGFNNNEVFFVTFSSATLKETALIMQQLGAKEAMNLDGGASSGLWCGRDLVKPGRELSNALILKPR